MSRASKMRVVRESEPNVLSSAGKAAGGIDLGYNATHGGVRRGPERDAYGGRRDDLQIAELIG